MIETYWNEQFGEFKVDERHFELPGFPEPFMSPHFGVRNIISGKAIAGEQNYWLCYFYSKKRNNKFQLKMESLDVVVSSVRFWEFQQCHHPEAYAFMKRLLPFLHVNKKKHFHLFLEENGELIGSAIMGVGSTTNFLFNLSVHNDRRKLGIAKDMTMDVLQKFSDKNFFYWTKHSWFTLGADEVANYSILGRGRGSSDL